MCFHLAQLQASAYLVRAVLVLVLLGMLAGPSYADSTARESSGLFRKARFVHVADRQPVADLIRSFASAQGWRLVLTGPVDGSVSARFALDSEKFWDMLVQSQNLVAYYDGQFMHVGPVTEAVSETLSMSPVLFRRYVEALQSLRIADGKNPLRYDASTQVAVLSGHPRYVQLAASVWEQMSSQGEGRTGLVTRVFKLKSALAADRWLRTGDQEIKVEGVASMVRRILGRAPGQETAAEPESFISSDDATRLRGARAERPRADSGNPWLQLPPSRPDRQSMSGQPLKDASATAPGASFPTASAPARKRVVRDAERIEAEEGINAVIVRDRADRMEEYEALIAQLDQARGLIEIEAQMIEVERGDLAELGIDWSATSGRGSIVSNAGGAQSVTDGTGPQLIATLIDGATTRLMSRVKALESKGAARVVLSPRLLTLNHTEATIENTETAFVRVAGNQDANLFSVKAGSALRILPSLIENGSERRIRLLLTIEDGVFAREKVDNVPVVQRHRINTQSEVAEGATLLIGGLRDVRERKGKDGIPFLSGLPVVGALFGSSSSSQSSRERLYLITPRLVKPDRQDVALASPAWVAAPQARKEPPGTARVPTTDFLRELN